jgi:hypothetical protein
LVTIDRSLAAQQNMTDRTIGVIVVSARSNSFRALAPLLSELLQALTVGTPGQVLRLHASPKPAAQH